MSYVVIRVYSFECDHPGCEETTECGGPELRDALRELRWAPVGWTLTGRGRKRRTYCPEHKPQEVMPDEPVAERRDLDSPRNDGSYDASFLDGSGNRSPDIWRLPARASE